LQHFVADWEIYWLFHLAGNCVVYLEITDVYQMSQTNLIISYTLL